MNRFYIALRLAMVLAFSGLFYLNFSYDASSVGSCSIVQQQAFVAGTMAYCDGSNWISMKGSSVGSCSVAGETSVTSTPDFVFCDGSTLWSMKGPSLGSCAAQGQSSWVNGAPAICLSGVLYGVTTPSVLINQAFQYLYQRQPTSLELSYWLSSASGAAGLSLPALERLILTSQSLLVATTGGIPDPVANRTWNGSGWTAWQTHYAAVVVVPPSNGVGNGTVFLPDGSTLNVNGSVTSGLQEALNYANVWGWDLFIYGAGKFSTTGTYSLQAPLIFQAMQGKTIRFMNVDLEFGSGVTDSAFIFDSCMMVELELTGKINAPWAAIGARFNAVSPFPLDGRLGHGSGITDSRFEFGQINTSSFGVYFNQLALGVFYVGGGSYKTAVGGGGNCPDCIFETTGEVQKSHIHDTSVTLDIFNPTGVVVLPPVGALGSGNGIVVLPDGSILPTPSSQTGGIQEAITYAEQRGLDLAVYGRGLQVNQIQGQGSSVTYPTNGFYQVNASLLFTPFNGQTDRIYNATLNYGGGTSIGAAMVVQQANNFEMELTGQIITQASGILLTSASAGIEYSVFKLGSVVSGAVDFEVQAQGFEINSNFFSFREPCDGQYGISLRSTAGQLINGNYIRSNHVHGQTIGGVDFQDPASTNLYTYNRFDLSQNNDGNKPFGIGIGGSYNTVAAKAESNIFYKNNGPGDSLIPLAGRPAAY